MNEHYDMDVSSPSYSRLRREHPELLIGRVGEELPKPSLQWGIRTGLNYAFPQVRSYMSSIIAELLERFDVDGVELDFMRHPAFFRTEEAYANRYLMTDLVRYVRRRMDELADEKGRPLDLIVRVPPTIRDCVRIGLDVVEWIRADLVDIVVAGGGFRPFEMPTGEFVEAARDTGCRVYGCLEALRPAVDELTLRAIAARYWDKGVDGLYLFNFYSMSSDWKQHVLADLADRVRLGNLDKRDVEGAISQREPLECTLGLLFENLGEKDVPAVAVNGVQLDWNDGKKSDKGWSREAYGAGWNIYPTRTTVETDKGFSVEFAVDISRLRRGVNDIEIRLVSRDPKRSGRLILTHARLELRYDRRPRSL